MSSEQFFPPFFKYKRCNSPGISNGMYSLLLYVLLRPEFPLYPSYQQNPDLQCHMLTAALALSCMTVRLGFLFVCFSHCETESPGDSGFPTSALLAARPAIYSAASTCLVLLRPSSLQKSSAPECPLLTQTLNREWLFTVCLSGLPPPVHPHRRVLPQAHPPNKKLLLVDCFCI